MAANSNHNCAPEGNAFRFVAPQAESEQGHIELTVLMPCLNEAETLGTCIDKANLYLGKSNISGEILIADNGSIDGSVEIARARGARVVHVATKGYGAALSAGIEHAKGKYVIMGDSDDSYDFSALDPFVHALRAGSQLVMGNRFAGGIAPGAMPPLHRYFGNPLLSFLGRLLFSARIRDFHCGLRGFHRQAVLDLHLVSPGMEFAGEMVVRASIARLSIAEVPTTLSPDGRSRPPHLRSWRDGWRNLRLLLLFSPRWLFIYPGLAIVILGTVLSLILLQGPVKLSPNVTIDVHSFIVACMATLVGAQCLSFGIVARRYAASRGLLRVDPLLDRLNRVVSLEAILIVAALMFIVGLTGIGASVARWAAADFGPLQYGSMIRILLISATLVALALQTAFTAFLATLFEIGRADIRGRDSDATAE